MATDTDILDQATIGRLRADLGSDFADEIAALAEEYGAQVRADVVGMRQAHADGQAAQIALLAHKLRGASATLGARRPEQLCYQLEYTLAAGAAVPEVLDELATTGAEAAAALASLAAELAV